MRQDRRRHLHRQIARHELDMTHVTERKGSPQTLVCTKTRRNYQRRCKEYRQEAVALAALAELADLADLAEGGAFVAQRELPPRPPYQDLEISQLISTHEVRTMTP
jgi:hypothetical protein